MQAYSEILTPHTCPVCKKDMASGRSLTVDGRLVYAYRCDACNKEFKVVSNEWLQRNVDYKQDRDRLCNYYVSGTDDEINAYFNRMEEKYGKYIDIDPLISWYKIESYTKVGAETFERVTKRSEKEYKRINATDTVPLFLEDIEIIDNFKKRYEVIRKDYLKAEEKRRKKSKLATIISAAAVFLIAVGVFLALYLTPKTLSDSDTGITVKVEHGNLSFFDKLAVDISVEEMEESSPEYSVATSLLHKVSEKYKIFDIFITKDGRELSPDGYVTVTMPFDSSFRKENIAVYYIASDGSCEELEYSLDHAEKTISFETNHFSLYAFVEKPYDVGFNTDGGSSVEGQKVLWGHGPEKPADPTKEGYTFLKWVKESDLSSWDFDNAAITHDEMLLATWEANSYTVSLNANGGEIAETVLSVTFGEEFSLPSPARRGYVFKGWLIDNKIISGGIWRTASDVTLTADWEIGSYTVGLYTDSGLVKEYTVAYESTFLPELAPTREGYSFAGWYSEPECINEVSSLVMPAENVKLYAGWTKNAYTVSFNAGEGISLDSKTLLYSEKYGVLPTPTKIGYSFVCWMLGDTPIYANTPVTVAQDHTLVAKWDVNSYKISWDMGGVNVTSPSAGTVKYGTAYGTLPEPHAPGFKFLGWYLGNDKISSDTVCTTSSEHTLTARWELESYTVSFDATGGECDVSEKSVKYTSEYGMLPIPTRAGYEFVRWVCNSKEINSDTVCTLTYSHTLTAEWRAKSFKVTLDPSGGECDTSELTVYYSRTYGLLPTPSKDGYVFLGWMLGETKVDSNTVCNTASDHTLVASFKKGEYKVTLDANGGTCSIGSVSASYSEVYGILPTPTREGYSFIEWRLGDVSVDENTVCETPRNHTLKAVWRANTYKLTFDTPLAGETEYTATYDSPYGALPTPEKAGYTFIGWTLSDNEVNAETVCKTASDHTLTAIWEAKKITVTLDLDGGTHSYTTFTVTFGERYGSHRPEKEGYYFSSWVLGSEKIEYDTLCTTPTDHTLKAVWNPKLYTVTLDPNGGALDDTDTIVYYNGKYEYLYHKPTREGYTFDGWTYEGVDVTDEFICTVASDHTLVAKWKGNKYKVVLDSGNSSSVIEVEYGMPYGTLCQGGRLPIPSVAGKTFVTWTLADEAINSSTICSTAKDHTLIASFDGNLFAVTLNADGGTVSPSTLSVKHGEPYGAISTPEKVGKVFSHWELDGQKIASDSICYATGNHTLKAIYKNASYSIVWDLNGGTAATALPQSYSYGEGVKSFPSATKKGMLFVGWYIVDGKKETFAESIPSTATGTVTLKARWFKNTEITSNDVWERSMETDSKSGYASNVDAAITVEIPEELRHYAEKGLLGITVRAKFLVKVRSSGNATGTVTASIKINGTDYAVCSKSVKGGGYSYWNGFWTAPCKGDWASNTAEITRSLEFDDSGIIKIGYRYDMSSNKENDSVTTDIYYLCKTVSYEFYIK